jgi:hypothetical protein
VLAMVGWLITGGGAIAVIWRALLVEVEVRDFLDGGGAESEGVESRVRDLELLSVFGFTLSFVSEFP